VNSGIYGFRDEAALCDNTFQQYGQIFIMNADGSEKRALTDSRWGGLDAPPDTGKASVMTLRKRPVRRDEMSGCGTFRTWQPRQPMSGFRGKAAVPKKS
jgi:hypothetical protein